MRAWRTGRSGLSRSVSWAVMIATGSARSGFGSQTPSASSGTAVRRALPAAWRCSRERCFCARRGSRDAAATGAVAPLRAAGAALFAAVPFAAGLRIGGRPSACAAWSSAVWATCSTAARTDGRSGFAAGALPSRPGRSPSSPRAASSSGRVAVTGGCLRLACRHRRLPLPDAPRAGGPRRLVGPSYPRSLAASRRDGRRFRAAARRAGWSRGPEGGMIAAQIDSKGRLWSRRARARGSE